MEVVEADRSDSATDAGGDRLAHVADEVRNAEQLRGFLLTLHL